MSTVSSASTTVDPVDLSIVWSKLISIAEEMGSALRSTAWSAAVREGDDFSTGIFDAKGRLLAQGSFGPGHMGSMPKLVAAVLSQYAPATLRPGDAIIANDSVINSGHLPDIFMVSPAFMSEELIGYVVCIAHHVDVGGPSPGSQQVSHIGSVFAEGIRIVPVMLYKEGVLQEDVFRIIAGNVRLPETLGGDLDAQRSANYVGAEKLAGLFEEYGRGRVERLVNALLENSEAQMRRSISRLPRGRYEFTDWLDDAGPDTEPVRFSVAVTISEDEIELDFSESSDQVSAALNCYANFTQAYGTFAVRALIESDISHNEGSMRPIKVVSRPGSFFNPLFPAPSGGRAITQVRIFEAVNGALAKAVPDLALAGFSQWSNPNISGTDELGRPFIHYDLVFGGYGGRSGFDGIEGMSPVLNCANVPIEVMEAAGNLRVRCFELIPDTGGAGQYRGGCGIRKEYEILAKEVVITLLGERHKFQPYGLMGGQAGALATTTVLSAGIETAYPSKAIVSLKRGDIVQLCLSGGGGYGDPKDRSVEQIRTDIVEGYQTTAAAIESYPVFAALGGGKGAG